MASNLPAPEGTEIQEPPTAGAWGEWNPTEDSVRPVRGKHRVAKPRGGLARSSTVLGVGVIAAVGAAWASPMRRTGPRSRYPCRRCPICLICPTSCPAATPGSRTAVPGRRPRRPRGRGSSRSRATAARPTCGEVLRNRILQQAESQKDAAEAKVRADAERAAQEAAAQEAKDSLEEARRAAEEAKAQAEAKAAEEAEAARKAAEAQAEQERAKAAAWLPLPTSAYTLTSHYGVSGSMWSSGYHTGLDFAAPTGTPAKAVAAGKITSAKLVRRVRLPDRAAARGRHGDLVLPPLLDVRDLGHGRQPARPSAASAPPGTSPDLISTWKYARAVRRWTRWRGWSPRA